MTNRFVANPLFDHQLRQSLIIKLAVERAAEAIADKATLLAPVDEGDYRAALTSSSSIGARGWEGKVEAKDWKSGWIEFGTSQTPASAPLRRGAELSGMRLHSALPE